MTKKKAIHVGIRTHYSSILCKLVDDGQFNQITGTRRQNIQNEEYCKAEHTFSHARYLHELAVHVRIQDDRHVDETLRFHRVPSHIHLTNRVGRGVGGE